MVLCDVIMRVGRGTLAGTSGPVATFFSTSLRRSLLRRTSTACEPTHTPHTRRVACGPEEREVGQGERVIHAIGTARPCVCSLNMQRAAVGAAATA